MKTAVKYILHDLKKSKLSIFLDLRNFCHIWERADLYCQFLRQYRIL